MSTRAIRLLALGSLVALGACSNTAAPTADSSDPGERIQQLQDQRNKVSSSTVWDLFKQRDDGTKVAVNRYLWNASLDVLSFLPVESVDPFTGVISFGLGTAPGGNRKYRGTVLISDPALEARSLNVALQDASGHPVDAATDKAVEDAILTRARALLKADKGR